MGTASTAPSRWSCIPVKMLQNIDGRGLFRTCRSPESLLQHSVVPSIPTVAREPLHQPFPLTWVVRHEVDRVHHSVMIKGKWCSS